MGAPVGQGLELAVPITATTRRIVDTLVRGGHVRRWFLGVEGATRRLRPRAAETTGRDEGIEVQRVIADSPAVRAGLRAGDVVVGLDLQPVAGAGQLQGMLTAQPPGAVELEVVRDQEVLAIVVDPVMVGSGH